MKKLLIPFALLLAFASCKKSDSSSCSLSSTTILGSYKVTAATFRATGTSTDIDMYSLYFDDCEKDDIVTFSTGGVYTITDAGTVCSPTSADAGTWSLSGNTLTMDGDATTVASFTCSKVVMTQTVSSPAAGTMTITVTRQ